MIKTKIVIKHRYKFTDEDKTYLLERIRLNFEKHKEITDIFIEERVDV